MKLSGQPILCLSQSNMADSVNILGQVHKGDVEADILFLILVLQLPYSKSDIYCSMALTESTLRVREG